MSLKVFMFLYIFFCPKVKSNKSNEIWPWASSVPVFLKKLFEDYQRSILSVPAFGGFAAFAGSNLGCLKIIWDV